MSQKVTTGCPILRIADKNQIPATEPERQYYFIDIARRVCKTAFRGKRKSADFPCFHIRMSYCISKTDVVIF